MYVEDLLVSINDHFYYRPFGGILDGEWQRNFIRNVASHIKSGHQLSTNQSLAILKLVARARKFIVEYGLASDPDVADMLANPQHRRPLYESTTIPREVRHLGSNLLGFRYKQNDLIKKQLQKFGEPCTTQWLCHDLGYLNLELIARPSFDWSQRIWVVPVFRHNILDVVTFIRDYRFGVDPATANYLGLAMRSFDKPSAFAISDDIIVANVCDNPILASWITDIAEGAAL